MRKKVKYIITRTKLGVDTREISVSSILINSIIVNHTLCYFLIIFFLCSLQEKIQVYESTSSSSSFVSKEISSIDSLAFAFGSQEHFGRVGVWVWVLAHLKCLALRVIHIVKRLQIILLMLNYRIKLVFLVLIMMHYFFQI